VKPALSGWFYILETFEARIMLVGKCPKCGKQYFGWALSKQAYRTCPDCRSSLVVRSMSGNYQPNRDTLVASQREDIAELQAAREEKMPDLLL
jgi:DNA-directed RNA polymerase subunit RPC12/RpoP